uniref:Uncharacterized protein n=1 Tax=Cucumis sativus TaxID=3659 RepID=A0A0A0KWD8_CUCSA
MSKKAVLVVLAMVFLLATRSQFCQSHRPSPLMRKVNSDEIVLLGAIANLIHY